MTTSWFAAVEEALQLRREFNRLNEGGLKPTAAAVFKEALRLGNSTPQRIADLRKALGDSGSSPYAVAYIRSTVRWIGEGHAGVPRESRRLNYLGTPGALERARPEFAILGNFNDYEAYAVALQIASEKHPDAFGPNDDPQATQLRFEQVKARLDELYPVIGGHFPGELISPEWDSSGQRATLWFGVTLSASRELGTRIAELRQERIAELEERERQGYRVQPSEYAEAGDLELLRKEVLIDPEFRERYSRMGDGVSVNRDIADSGRRLVEWLIRNPDVRIEAPNSAAAARPARNSIIGRGRARGRIAQELRG